jgi:alanine racemase
VAEWLDAGQGRPAALHIDTGMNRMGFGLDELDRARDLAGRLRPALVMSHFVASEVPDAPMNARQINAFRDQVRPAFHNLGAGFSLLNSSGHFLEGVEPHDLTRPGYALYGGNPTPGAPNPMQAVVRLEATIVSTRQIRTGTSAGYNSRWVAARDSRLATISMGYADGYPRNGGGTRERTGGHAMLAGVKCPFVGTVSMDLVILDVTDVPEHAARRGASVTLIGDGISLDEAGAGAMTIGYEMLTSLGQRYQRKVI